MSTVITDDELDDIETIAQAYGVKRAAEIFHRHDRETYLTLSQEQLAAIITGAYVAGHNEGGE